MTLGRLAELPPEELRMEWARRYGVPAPNLSPELLRLGIGYRLQEQRHGGLGRSTRSLLRQHAARAGKSETKGPSLRKLMPGTRLVRDWHGVGHTVVVLENGFEYDGRYWKSLTAVARAITGAHWNGPRFFGLSEPKQ
ncbi:DUF2924 domain-containing protein [Edaphosphingomonas haloaromaticamans]|uniref:DUF2924 domain-containing protein n=1 Tax=Edaphosphingomonas haloaromaticamans TaxID=653954 RepID=A0A1S1H9B4_9SPHN|nr:DUF2924 domain-containing protein [Sphingomonas haloaromaticamans]OHT18226.1 hypothetical protein BHE75_00197 [Sphingomonas haloaromaticamans]